MNTLKELIFQINERSRPSIFLPRFKHLFKHNWRKSSGYYLIEKRSIHIGYTQVCTSCGAHSQAIVGRAAIREENGKTVFYIPQGMRDGAA